ncbi:MAG: GlsB/YeaQ/YmgE family stress response membrane protein [Candidatus Fermentibacteria bacterium]
MSIIGFICTLIITIFIVGIVEKISKTKLPYGWIGNIIVGFIGGVLGQYVLGNTWGPSIFGVLIVQVFLGSLALILIGKWVMGFIAKGRG